MATAEEYISSQKKIAQQIADVIRNFKKDGPTRRTKEYLAKRLKELEEHWSTFTSLHEQVEQFIPQDHPYHIEQLFDRTYDIYKAGIEMISNYKDKPQLPTGNETISPGEHTTLKLPITATTHTSPATVPCSNYTFPSATSITTIAQNQMIFTKAIPKTTVTENYTPMTALNKELPTTSSAPTANLSGTMQQQAMTFPYYTGSRENNFPKLPPIKIPKFDGNYKEWRSFIDIFTNVIHNNLCLSNVEKMQYLLYHLEGDARRVINHLQLNNSNYNTALSLIQARYSNNRKIITTYINTIIDVKNIEHRSQEDIIMLYDTIRECLEALKNLNCDTDNWGPIIVCIAMRKLDPESLRLFEESLPDPKEMPSINDLLRFLDKRHQVLDCIKNSKQQRHNTFKSPKKTFHATIKSSCMICNKHHYLYQCTEFKKMSINERQAFVKQKKLCTNCLTHNKSAICKSSKLCTLCNKRHHTLLHQQVQNEIATNGDTNHVTTHLATNTCREHYIHSEKTRDTNVSCHTNNLRFPNVLLPTAIVRIKNIYVFIPKHIIY